MKLKVFVAGGTGWAGSALCRGIINSPKMELVGALSKSHAGEDLAKFLNMEVNEIPIFSDIKTALEKVDFDILVDFTSPSIAKNNIISSLEKGKNIIVGTSGLDDNDYEDIEKKAVENNCSVLAVGNFAISVVLMQKFSEMAAKYIANFEIIDYAKESKIDSPSGTVNELALRMSKVQKPNEFVSEAQLVGRSETRGASINGVRVHAIRLPSFVISVETIFAQDDERLTIRQDSGSSAEIYVKGGLLAIEKVNSFKGLKRGLDTVMEF